jgi:osmotically-inducible protein OsmY
MKFFVTFLIGALAGIAGYWFLNQPKTERTASDMAERVRDQASHAAKEVKELFDVDRIKEELGKTGKVIREKSRKAGDAIVDAAENAKTTTVIKAKLLKESSLASLKIDVDTSDGVVTLSGTVNSYDEIVTAMKLALETPGVHRVISSLQVKSS